MGASQNISPQQSTPFLPSPQFPPDASSPAFGFPVPIQTPFESNSPAYFLLPVYHLRHRRCSCCLPLISTSFAFISIVILSFIVFLLWPSDPALSIARLRLDRFRVDPLPSGSIDIAMGLEIKIRNPDFVAIKYSSLVVSIFYRGELLGSVDSAGGLVAARQVSYVDADLHLDGARVLHNIFYLIGDAAKGSVNFETVTEVRGWLRAIFFDFPIKGKLSCIVHINPNTQSISYHNCYPA